MKVWLKPHVHAAVYGPDLVLLDVGEGRYALLAGAADLVDIQDRASAIVSDEPLLFEALRGLDAVASDRPCIVRAERPPLPQDSIPFETAPALSLCDRWTMGRGWLDMVWIYHGRSFPALIAAAGAQPSPDELAETERIVRTAILFDRQSPWIPFQGDCLYRCLMLRRILQRQGLSAHWVFGVRTWPFYAHCWLQAGELALTDHAERLAGYSPILAI